MVDEVDVDTRPGILRGPLVPVAFVRSLVRGIYGAGFWRVVALKALLLEGERMGSPVHPLCHRELLKGGGGVPGVCDGRVVEGEEVDGSLDGRGLGLSGPSSRALAPSGRRTGARGLFAGWWALGWAWWGEALAPLRGDFPSVLGAPVGLVQGGDASDGVVALELQGVTALVQLPLGVPGHPDLHPTVWARFLEALLDRALAPDPVARVVVAEGLLDSRALLKLRVCFGLGRCPLREGG